MEVGLKKRLYADGLAREVPGAGDAADQMVLGDLADDDTFEIPLKTRYSRNSNFPELDEDFSCIRDSTNGNVEKKVRFDAGDEPAVRRSNETSESRSDSARGKKNVEDLLQYANQLNDYLAQNLDKINTFRSALLSDEQLYMPLSNAATQATTLSASMSNFELSDNEGEDHDLLSPATTAPEISGTDYGVLSKSSDSLLNTVPRNVSSADSSDSGSKHSTDHTLENSPQVDNTDVLNSPELDQHLQDLALRQLFKSREPALEKDSGIFSPQEHSLILTDENTAVHEIPDLTEEEGITILLDTIDHILKLSESKAQDAPEQDTGSSEYTIFTMKSTPTVTCSQLIARMQSKCMFGSIVYLAATFLIQTCFLTRDEQGQLVLRRPLTQRQTHRLVIATVRVATKLLEDFVHSHQYFCKVCGVSKKLLTRLEVALIICLKNDGLMITSEKLAATRPINAELKSNEPN
ncbi:hypothetical protein HG536_0E05550 [Torulaspora globosa]|uniref:Uncharacterized protein n=1 Tax=Torulaspora globosa TaxID=48254 RepID=A0A7G3ZJF8_9SACH|nr:uncharacterized protein HG536_0E05550 [Torulaspora globosa]QLL33644.1 hypothetical protein HG536_0E05550 [Torulaspora globosa]